ncbi:MAG: hypothetical protein JWM63_5307 [Gammaproteobacteria bacterium]|nr:hypothetical protein [Gammaproteobacteria bacterium]
MKSSSSRRVKRSYSVSLEPWLAERLREIGGGNRSKAVRLLFEQLSLRELSDEAGALHPRAGKGQVVTRSVTKPTEILVTKCGFAPVGGRKHEGNQ